MGFWEDLVNLDPLGIYHALTGTPSNKPVVPSEVNVDWGKLWQVAGIGAVMVGGVMLYGAARRATR